MQFDGPTTRLTGSARCGRRALTARVVLFLSTFLTACGGGGDSGTNPTPVTQTPAISISVSSSTASVTQGATTTVQVTLTRSGGFAGAATVTVEGLSAGVTASALTIGEGQTSGAITLTASASATTGTASLTIRATGTGVTAATASVSLSVVASTPPPGGFTLSLNPATVSLAQSGTANITATIARTGSFTGAVSFAVSGLPTGVTASVNPTSVTGTSATITLTASASATAGSATVTITGSGTGVSNQSGTIALTVTTTAPSNGNVTWKFCGISGLPLWVAAQDGTGAWSRITGTNNTYSFNVSAKGGVAYVVQMANGGYDLEVFYGSTADLQGQGSGLCNGDVGSGKTVSSTVANAGATDLVLPTLGHSVGTVTSGAVSFKNVMNGTLDLVASRATVGLVGTTVSYTINKLLIRRNLNPADNSTLPVIDFNSSEAFTPVTKNVTIGNLGTDVSLVVGAYVTSNNTVGAYLTDISGSTATTRTYPAVPSANQAAGDFHVLNVIAEQNLLATLNNTRQAGVIFHDAADKTVTLGPPLTAPTMSVLGSSPYARIHTAITVQAEYNKLFDVDLQQTGSNARRTHMQQTAGYGAGNAVTLDIPDFSSVAGFDATWGLRAGTSVTYTILGTGWTGAGGVTGTPYTDGATYLSATRMGTITP